MSRHERNTFNNATATLDGNEFINCIFQNSELVYEGGTLPTLSNNSFQGQVRVTFHGSAANTIAFLKALAKPGSGFQNAVKEMFPEIFGQERRPNSS